MPRDDHKPLETLCSVSGFRWRPVRCGAVIEVATETTQGHYIGVYGREQDAAHQC